MNINNIKHWQDDNHKEYFEKFLKDDNTRGGDSERIALFYILSSSDSLRRNIKSIYDFKKGWINPECLSEPFQTGATTALTRFAFNLYNGHKDIDEDNICRSTPIDIFHYSAFREVFLQAINIRF